MANWQDPPFNRWAFQHVRELIPTQPIAKGSGPSRSLTAHERLLDPSDVTVRRLNGGVSTLESVIAETWTDAVVILHEGMVVHETYDNGMTAQTPHLLMSVSKSVVGCIAGILAEGGVLDTDAPTTRYVPEVAHSGYGGTTVRHLLDMRTGVAYSEEYTDPNAEVRLMERAMGWRPAVPGEEAGGMYAYLASVGRDGEHGGSFVYRSADTDLLGWVCERASGRPMAELISNLLWQPLGAEFEAEITCDALGAAVHDGGMSARARDMARFGQMLLDHGEVGGRSVVPEAWLRQARTLDDATRKAFAASSSEPYLTGGWYRNQFWFVPGPVAELQLCLGIHGQMVMVDRATRTVSVKMSTWPSAQDAVALIDTIRAFVAAGAHLAARGGDQSQAAGLSADSGSQVCGSRRG
ncbi:serine hydrolase domain-containing protein [Marmoricola sp. URHA0025 HA25]